MPARSLFPIVACRRLARTHKFYIDALGAVPSYQYPEGGEPVFAVLKVGGSELGLSDGAGKTAYGKDALPTRGHPIDLCIYVDDLDATLKTSVAHGAELAVEAKDMPWGERVAWLKDPEGVMLLVIQAQDDKK